MSYQDVYQQIRATVDCEEDNSSSSSSSSSSSDDLLSRVLKSSFAASGGWQNVLGHVDSGTVSVEEANEKRDEGTKLFRSNKLEAAIKSYSSYLRMCHKLVPTVSKADKDKLLYQGYANRSAVLFRDHQFKTCLQDIEAALQYSPGKATEYLLVDRRARCKTILGKWTEAAADFHVALKAIEQALEVPEQIKEAFVKQVEAHLAKLPQSNQVEEDQEEGETGVIVLTKQNSDHVGLSNHTKVKYSEKKGRYLVASKNIAAGEIVAVEDANVSFAHFDAASNESKACHHCVAAINVAYFSPIVDGVAFCSWKCLTEAMASYHQYERFILHDYLAQIRQGNDQLEKSGCMFLAFRAVCQRPLAFFTSNNRAGLFMREDTSYGLNKDDDSLSLEESQLMYLYNLVTHEAEMPAEERLRTAIRSVILLQCLKASAYFGPEPHQELDELLIMRLLYRLQLGVTHNVHLIYKVKGDFSGDIPLGLVGSAIYHDLVLLNHSCAANTTRFFQGGQMVLIAKRSIKGGEEISNNYGIHHNNLGVKKRQAALKRGYKFECDCEACANDYPLLGAVDSKLNSGLAKIIEGLLAKYQQLFANGYLEEARDTCVTYLSKLEEAGVKYPHRSYEIGAVALNSCWWAIINRQSQLAALC